MSGGCRVSDTNLSRRSVVKGILRTGAYAAPVILSVSAVRPVAAQVSPARTSATSTPTTAAFVQSTATPIPPTATPVPPTATPVPLTATSIPATATSVPVVGGMATIMAVVGSPMPGAPIAITGAGFTPGRVLQVQFRTPSGTEVGVPLQTIVSAAGAFRGFTRNYFLPVGTLTASVVDQNGSVFPRPILASTMFANTDSTARTLIQFDGNSSVIAGTPVTVGGFNLTPGAAFIISVIAADGTTVRTIPVTATPMTMTDFGGRLTATFPTTGLPLGDFFATIGPAGSSEVIDFAQGRIV